MKFVQRLGYYMGGFAIGLVILAFFLSGKNASCDYGPNARTVKNIASKPLAYSLSSKEFIIKNDLDSTTISNLIRYGDVNFSKSNTSLDSCNQYYISNSYKSKSYNLLIKNCDSIATLLSINK